MKNKKPEISNPDPNPNPPFFLESESGSLLSSSESESSPKSSESGFQSESGFRFAHHWCRSTVCILVSVYFYYCVGCETVPCTITNSDLNRPCFAWHPYGKSGLFKTELVILVYMLLNDLNSRVSIRYYLTKMYFFINRLGRSSDDIIQATKWRQRCITER